MLFDSVTSSVSLSLAVALTCVAADCALGSTAMPASAACDTPMVRHPHPTFLEAPYSVESQSQHRVERERKRGEKKEKE